MSLTREGIKGPTRVQLKRTSQAENSTVFSARNTLSIFSSVTVRWHISDISLFVHNNEKMVIYCFQSINVKYFLGTAKCLSGNEKTLIQEENKTYFHQPTQD